MVGYEISSDETCFAVTTEIQLGCYESDPTEPARYLCLESLEGVLVYVSLWEGQKWSVPEGYSMVECPATLDRACDCPPKRRHIGTVIDPEIGCSLGTTREVACLLSENLGMAVACHRTSDGQVVATNTTPRSVISYPGIQLLRQCSTFPSSDEPCD